MTNTDRIRRYLSTQTDNRLKELVVEGQALCFRCSLQTCPAGCHIGNVERLLADELKRRYQLC